MVFFSLKPAPPLVQHQSNTNQSVTGSICETKGGDHFQHTTHRGEVTLSEKLIGDLQPTKYVFLFLGKSHFQLTSVNFPSIPSTLLII